jgi:predicted AlkP superfamily pyrophosphatase or phosphodiesterase
MGAARAQGRRCHRRCAAAARAALFILRNTRPLFSASVLSFVGWLHSTRGYGASSTEASQAAGRRTLLVISMDGFRAEYMQSLSQYLPNINAFFSDGVKSKGIRPSFPSLTFPNHYTIATGLYPSAHGIVANSFVDPRTLQRFSMASGSLEPHWWGGEPLWVTARKAGLNAYVYFWPGSEVELHGYRPTQYKQYEPDRSLPARFALYVLQQSSTSSEWNARAHVT